MAFGYEGDATGDSASLAGTGSFAFDDPERGGTPMVPGKDAALKKDDAELIYHVQPGETFTNPEDGKTYRYADTIPDWSPAKPGYVDVYDPSHAPDNVTSKGHRVTLRSGYDDTTPPEPVTQTDDYIEDSRDQVEETTQQPKQSPLDSFKTQYPEYRTTPDSELLTRMHARMAPNMPMDQFSELAKLPDGSHAISLIENKGLSGLQILKRDFADTGATDQQLLQGMYDRLSSNGKIDGTVKSFQDFKDQMDPGSGPLNAAYNFWKGMSRGSSAATHGASGDIYSKPQDVRDFSTAFYGLMNNVGNMVSPGTNAGSQAQSWAKAADEWMAKNTGAENYWRDFVGFMNGRKDAQEKAMIRDQKRAAQARGISGKAGNIVGQAGTGTGLMLATIAVPGAPLKTALTLAGAWEGLSRTGAAVQAGHDNALIEGIQGAGMGSLMRYMMESPAGRKTSAFTMWAANTGEDTLQKWLRGEKVDWLEQGLRSTVDITLGALSAQEAGAPRTQEEWRASALPGNIRKAGGPIAEDVISRREVSADDILGTDTGGGGAWYAKDPVSTRGAPSVFTPQSLLEATGRLPKRGSPEEMQAAAERMKPAGGGVYLSEPDSGLKTNGLHPAVSEEIDAAFKAREGGDYKSAGEHIDAAMAIMSPKERKDVAQKVIKVTHDAANIHKPKTTPVKDKSDDIIHQNLYGITPKRNKSTGANRQSGYTLDWAGEIHDWFRDNWPEIKNKLKGPARGVASVFEHNLHDVFAPAAGSKTGTAMDAISAYRTSEAAERTGIFSTKIARDMGVEQALKGGEKTGRRAEVFDNFRDGQLKDMLINEEEQGPRNTGNRAADFILGFHQVGYKAMQMVEKAAGIQYAAVKAYIYHNLKNPQQQEAFSKWFDTFHSGDPRFAHQREIPKLRDVFRAGFELKTLNPERLFQARLFAHTEAIRKIFTLRDAADEDGLAFRTNTPDLDPEIKKWTQVTSPARDAAGNHETYYVEPGAAKVLRNAWDQKNVYDVAFVGPIFKLAALGKGVTASLKLAWSLAHAKHMLKMGMTHALTQVTRMGLLGERRAAAWREAVSDVFSSGFDMNRKEVKAWRGEKLDSPLTHDEESNIEDAKQMGLDFSTNSERNMQFARGLSEMFPKWAKSVKIANQAVSHGYKILSSEFFQKFLFERIIPSMKFKAAMAFRDNLMRQHPEFNNPGMEVARKAALRKGGEAIDARFGEMFYNNLYWSKMAKDIGQASLLSLGWQIGFIRVYGGALKDMSSNAAHMNEIVKKIRGQKSEHTFLTDRILFAGYYTALNALEAGVYTYAAMKLNGEDDKHAFPQGRDYIFPRTAKDANGKYVRVQPIEYSREWASWHQHIMQEGGYPMGIAKGTSDFWSNKLQPFLQTLNQDWQNKNYFGMEVADKGDPNQFNQFMDHAKFWATNLALPIPFEGAFENTGGEYGLTDVARSVAGYPRSPAWTNRTDTENRITDKYHTRFAGTKSKADVDKQNAHQALRKAVLVKDDAGLKKAIDTLKAMKVTPKAIATLEHDAKKNVPYETYMFKRLSAYDQKEILDQMSPEEKKVYLPLAHKELRTGADTNVGDKGGEMPEWAKPGPYITKLSSDDESAFQAWVKKNHVPWEDSPVADYDMRGYWKAMVSGDPNAKQAKSNFDGHMHFPDTYKTPFHKTFSNESKYAKPDAPHWVGDRLIDKNGKVIADETPKS
jgi:hypothetical protein